MQNIFEIFKGNFMNQNNIIQTMDINSTEHKIGLQNILKSLVPDYNIDSSNKNTISHLFNYFTGNIEYCMHYDISLNKGILLCGGVGTGKSVLMQAIKLYTGKILMKNSFQSYQASEVIDNVNIHGVDYLDKFNTSRLDPITCFIDDICSKNEKVKVYGTEVSVIEQLISIRYNVFIRNRKLTHLSSNIYPIDMVKYYDERIIDRMKEMCNIIELPGLSRRN